MAIAVEEACGEFRRVVHHFAGSVVVSALAPNVRLLGARGDRTHDIGKTSYCSGLWQGGEGAVDGELVMAMEGVLFKLR